MCAQSGFGADCDIICANMNDGVGIVEPKKLKLKLPEGGYRLESGGVLHEIEVQYEECGAPLCKDNAVFICHALNSLGDCPHWK